MCAGLGLHRSFAGSGQAVTSTRLCPSGSSMEVSFLSLGLPKSDACNLYVVLQSAAHRGRNSPRYHATLFLRSNLSTTFPPPQCKISQYKYCIVKYERYKICH